MEQSTAAQARAEQSRALRLAAKAAHQHTVAAKPDRRTQAQLGPAKYRLGSSDSAGPPGEVGWTAEPTVPRYGGTKGYHRSSGDPSCWEQLLHGATAGDQAGCSIWDPGTLYLTYHCIV